VIDDDIGFAVGVSAYFAGRALRARAGFGKRDARAKY
jgi:hypothetical protein